MNGMHGIIFSYEKQTQLRELIEHRVHGSIPFAGDYRVVDFATDKVLVDSCPFAIIVRAGGNAYVNVCNDDFIKIYDSGFGLLLKVTNNYTD